MPTFDQEVPGHGRMLLALSSLAYDSGAPVPLLVHVHGAGGGYDHLATAAEWAPLREWLLANGWAWVEGTGGPDAAAGLYNWGNQGSRDAYLAYVAQARTLIDVGPVVVLGRSMGGLTGSWLATQSPIAGDVVGFIANSAVGSLFTGGGPEDTDLLTQATGVFAGTAIATAYGVPFGGGPSAWWGPLQVAAAGHDPAAWDASVWAGRQVLALYGTADTVVPWWPRGFSAAHARMGGASVSVVAKAGGTHAGGSAGTYAMVPEMGAFLTRVAGAYPALATGAVPAWVGTPGASHSVLPYPPMIAALPGASGVIVSEGNIAGPVVLRITGPVTNPRIVHVTPDGVTEFGLTCTLATTADYVWVDVEKRSVLKNLITPRPEWVTQRGWGTLQPGANAWVMTGDTLGAGANVQVIGTPAWQ